MKTMKTSEGQAMTYTARERKAVRFIDRTSKVLLSANDEGLPTAQGRALVFDRWFPRYNFQMMIASGSLDRYLDQNGGGFGPGKARLDVLYNHDSSQVPLASTEDNSLEAWVDEEALHYRLTFNTELERHREMVDALQTGRLDRSSASIYILKEKWDEDLTERTVTEVDMSGGEVSIVRVPANPSADVKMLASEDFAFFQDLGSHYAVATLEQVSPEPEPDADEGLLLDSKNLAVRMKRIQTDITFLNLQGTDAALTKQV